MGPHRGRLCFVSRVSHGTSRHVAQANAVCVVKFEKGIFDSDDECKENCECLGDSWEKERNDICRALGDCGPEINWVGEKGNKQGFKIEIGSAEDIEDEDNGGLFG